MPSNLPVLSPTIPRFAPGPGRAVGPEGLRGIHGMALPRQAERPLTPTMRQQIRVQRELGGLPRIETRPEFRPLARPEISPPVEVIRGLTHGPATRGFQPAPGAPTPEVIRGAPTREFRPSGSRRLQPGPSREFRQPAVVGVRERPLREFRGPSGLRTSMPREFRAAPPPVFRSEPRAVTPAPGGRSLTPQRSFHR